MGETVATGLGTAFSAVASTLWTQVGTVVSTISGQPLLLIPIGFVFVGGAIGIAKRLMRKK